MPPSPTIISPAFNRSRMVPFYERSKEITPNWIILPIRRTDEKGDSERSDEKRNAFFIYFFFFSRYTSSACSTLRARLALASTRVKNAKKKKKRLPHLPLPHHFSNGSSLCGHSNPFRGEIESMFWRPRREPLGRSEGILPPPPLKFFKFPDIIFVVFYKVFLSQISLSFSLLLLIHLFRIKNGDFFYQTLYDGKVL